MKKIIGTIFILSLLVFLTGFGVMAQDLVIMSSEAPVTMDPANTTAGFTTSVVAPAYDTLTNFDQDINVIPNLATNWYTSNDGKVWTYEIREGVTFHDGTNLDAEAVKISFDRILNPDSGLATRSRFADVVEEVVVVEDYTVEFHLHDSYPAFPHLTSINNSGIISPAAIEEGNQFLARNVVGSGPYKFVTWETGERVILERNEDYWGEEQDVERLIFTWNSEDSGRIMALQTGDADIIYPLPAVFADTIDNDPNLNLFEQPSDRAFWVALNQLHEPLDNVKVRQALNYATNRQALIDSILMGRGTLPNSPMGPISFGYDPDLEGYEYDIDKAQELMREAGYEDGFVLPVAVQEAEANIAEAIQGMWTEIGVDVEISQMEYGVWADVVFAGEEENEGYSTFANWAASLLDADGFLTPLFHTRNQPPAGANLGFYSNEEVDSLLDRAAVSVDPEERLELYSKAQRIIQDEGSHVTFFYENSLVGMNERVENIWVDATGVPVIRNPIINE